MCPLCLTSLAITATGVLSGGGVAAIALKNLASFATPQPANKKEK